MAFWSTNDVEPKRNFRFQVQLGGAASPILWWAQTVTIPAFDVSEVEHNYLDNKYYFPGRVSWNEVSFTLVDPISVDAVSQTNKILEDMGYTVKANENSNVTMSKTKAAGVALPAVVISVLNADGVAIEVWTLNNAFLKSAKFGDLDYSSDDLRKVEMSVRYDWAQCDTSGNTSGAQNTKSDFFKPV
jgi:hypothetical protein